MDGEDSILEATFSVVSMASYLLCCWSLFLPIILNELDITRNTDATMNPNHEGVCLLLSVNFLGKMEEKEKGKQTLVVKQKCLRYKNGTSET